MIWPISLLICYDLYTRNMIEWLNFWQYHQYWDKLRWIIWKIPTVSIFIKMQIWIQQMICNVLEPGLLAPRIFYNRRQWLATLAHPRISFVFTVGPFLRQSVPQHQGACNGDSGGPLQCFIHGKWYFSGIVSFGASGCDTNIASIYGKVYHEDINGFIESIIENNSWQSWSMVLIKYHRIRQLSRLGLINSQMLLVNNK